MKKFFLTMLVAFLATAANAQFMNTNGNNDGLSDISSGWSTIYLEYNNVGSSLSKDDDDYLYITGGNGASLGYSHAFGISKTVPLFIETGIAAQWAHGSDSKRYDSKDLNLVTAKVPVNLLYHFALPNSTVSLEPYAGLEAHVHVIGKLKSEEYDDYYEHYESKTFDLFSKKDMDEMGGDPCKRFQVGLNFGANVVFSDRVTCGLNYETDLSPFWKPSNILSCKLHTFSVRLGYRF